MKIRVQILPVSQPQGGVDDINGLAQVINSAWWEKGPKVRILNACLQDGLASSMQSLAPRRWD